MTSSLRLWAAPLSDLNPYQQLLYRHVRDLGVVAEPLSTDILLTAGPGVAHVHWPELVAGLRLPGMQGVRKPARVLRAMAGARRRGLRVVWTVHNLRAHDEDRRLVSTAFWHAFVRLVDACICLSPQARDLALRTYPALRRIDVHVIPLGLYRGVYPDGIDRDEARTRLDLPHDATVFVCFGRIRGYKGLPPLVRAFRETPGEQLRLVIAGKPDDPGVVSRLQAGAAEDPRIRLAATHVPDDEVQVYLRAADLVVVPYSAVLNSSAALLALSFDRPVLAAAMGSLGYLQLCAGRDWVRLYDGDLAAPALADAGAWARDRGERSFVEPPDWRWERIAEQTVAAYEQVLGRGS